MDISLETINDTTVAIIAGRVDSTTSKDLEAKFIPLIDSGMRKLVIDFAEVDFVSSESVLLFAIG